ncbi:hypothetical protein X975_21263, partial [Stegodyphus mimosarum]
MWNGDRKTKSVREVVENAPKTLDKEYLQVFYTALFHHKLEAYVSEFSLLVLRDSKIQ